MSESLRIYKAADYLRLSKEDGDFFLSPGKVESDSISSQRDLIHRFVSQHPDIKLVQEFIDDGYTGTNFDRPRFQKLMEAVESGEIDCIIVKDLSRFGREYIDAGNYIEKLFPRYGVRFIAVNDGIDTGSVMTAADNLIIPFKNLINDSYSRDISIKVRSSFETKRRRGDFISNFACYGYQRDPDNKNRLIVDAEAAEVVRDIYRWKIAGMSPERIANRLNALGVACPAAYKAACGSRYKSGFQKNAGACWSVKTVIRILTNEVYCGVLIQGKRTTPNYKVKKSILKDPSKWARVENSHEAIIAAQEFHIVQRLVQEDSRMSGGEAVRPLAGRVFCGKCGARVKRKSVIRESKTYVYYSCPNSGQCEPNSIREAELETAVLTTLQAQISLILDVQDVLGTEAAIAWESRQLRKLEAAIITQEDQIRKNKDLIGSVYEDYQNGVITQSEMMQLKENFSKRIAETESRIDSLKREMEESRDALNGHESWFSKFCIYRNVRTLTRPVVVNLIDRVNLFPGKRIEVVLRFQNQINELLQYAAERNGIHPSAGACQLDILKETV